MSDSDLHRAAVRLADVALALHCLSDPPRTLARADVCTACAAAAAVVDAVVKDLGQAAP
jgi:hypothetical protein